MPSNTPEDVVLLLFGPRFAAYQHATRRDNRRKLGSIPSSGSSLASYSTFQRASSTIDRQIDR
jgi:hypothetical protein